MRIVVTGTSSGVGKSCLEILSCYDHDVIGLDRESCDLSSKITRNLVPSCDILLNCAGTGVGGKIDYVKHNTDDVLEIMHVNLLAPMILSQQALAQNPNCKIVNITSTNNNRYWPNDLAYSLSKHSLSEFGRMLRVEYPESRILEIRLGLTASGFNASRYKREPHRFAELYANNKCLTPDEVAGKIITAMFDDTIKFLEISP